MTSVGRCIDRLLMSHPCCMLHVIPNRPKLTHIMMNGPTMIQLKKKKIHSAPSSGE